MPKKLNQITGMPQMKAAFSGWRTNITLTVVRNVINADGFNEPQTTTYNFKGTVQPLSAEQLQLKAEGDRAFEWLQIHIEIENSADYVELNDGDIIVYSGKNYKINGKSDYLLNNFIEYHAMEVTQ